MGWRGALRSMAAAARAAEREAQRKNKQQQTAAMFVASAQAVDEWETHVDRLVSIHTNLAAPIDWHAIADRPRPTEPVRDRSNEDRAKAKLADFRPKLLDFFRGGSQNLRDRLVAEVEEAAAADEESHRNDLDAHARAIAEWEEDSDLATLLLRGEASAIRKVVAEMRSLTETALVGTEIEFSIRDRFVHARPKVHGDDIVPKMRRRQLASGRLSETPMPVRQFHELYQDYVASAAFKTGGDLLQVLPLSEVYVTCVADLLNSQTGHLEATPILSVQLVRDTFSKLDLSRIDPSDALRNFRHAMAFSSTKGLSAVEPLIPLPSQDA